VFADSDNGSVEIVIATPPQLEASTDNGSVTVIPETPGAYAVDAGTDSGSVTTTSHRPAAPHRSPCHPTTATSPSATPHGLSASVCFSWRQLV
jgi:hypothetical protein